MSRFGVDFNKPELRYFSPAARRTAVASALAGKLQFIPTEAHLAPPLNDPRIEKLEVMINVDLAFGLYRDRAFAGTGLVDDYVPFGQKSSGFSVSGR